MKKSITLLRKLQTIVLKTILPIIYKALEKPNPEYGYTIYDKAYNDSFHYKNWSQINIMLAITGAIRGIRFGITSTKTVVPQTSYQIKVS